MKRRMFALGLTLLLALTGGAQAEYIMTEEEMQSIWQESFDRMGTTGEMGVKTLDDLAAFEEEYTANTGRERKDDLVFVSLPMEGDMPYEEALAYARKLILDKFGTPEEELDAMGVYPRFVDYVYMENESDWEFYFTPRTNTDVDLDHTYEGQGEYRVTFGAQTGTVEYVNWYIDQFFPVYAQRTWDAGKHDYVYQRAQRKDFWNQTMEEQAHFIELFKAEGYDVSALKRTDEELLKAMDLDLLFCEPESSLLSSDDPNVKTALAALETEYGLTKEMLEKYAFTATYSPMQTGTTDICFAFNYNIESSRYETGELSRYTGMAFTYVTRLGTYMVKIDPATGQSVKAVHAPRSQQAVQALDETTLLGRRDWTADDLPEFEQLLAQLSELDEKALAESQPDYQALEIACDEIMRSFGGDPAIYSSRGEQPTDIGKEKAVERAYEALMGERGLSRDEAEEQYGYEVYYVPTGVYSVYLWERNPNEYNGYHVAIDAPSGEVVEFGESQGNG